MVYEDSHCLPLVSSLIIRALALLRWIEPIQLCEEMEHWAISVAARWEADLRTTSSDFSSGIIFCCFSLQWSCSHTPFTKLFFFFLTVSLVCKSQRNKCVCGEDTRTFTCFCRMGEDEAGWERGTLGDVLFLMTISVRKLEESYVNMCLLQVWLLDLTAHGMALGCDLIVNAFLMSGVNGLPQCSAHLTYLLL